MANEYLVPEEGTLSQILFADHATDFGAAPATAANSLIIGTPTDVQMDMTSVAASGGARQSAQVDLGVNRAPAYSFTMCSEHAVAPSDADAMYLYWNPSPSSTAATGNTGGCTGSDAVFTDTVGNLSQMQRIGPLGLRNNVINIGYVGTIAPKHRHGSLVLVNQADQAMHTAMDETHIVMTPIIPEIQ